MRIAKEQERTSSQPEQCLLFEDDNYTYRIFCTSLAGPAHQVIAEYDKRADVENLVGEAKREGLDMLPSSKFKNNAAFFQIVMLAYNIWRYMKMMAEKSAAGHRQTGGGMLKGMMTHTVRIARLKLLFIAAKVVRAGNRDKVKYSIHDARTPAMLYLLRFIDKARCSPKPWCEAKAWSPRFVVQ
jgi:hypothetical protein